MRVWFSLIHSAGEKLFEVKKWPMSTLATLYFEYQKACSQAPSRPKASGLVRLPWAVIAHHELVLGGEGTQALGFADGR